jgi:leucyl aminopeptidase (aminopeptidase T)
VGARPGELILIRDHAGDRAVLEEVMLAVEAAGSTPLPEITNPAYLTQLLTETDPAVLARWDARRREWLHATDRIVKLAGAPLDRSQLSAAALQAWEGATDRLRAIEDERRVPSVLVALPVAGRAAALGLEPRELEEILLPALLTPAAELRAELERLIEAAGSAESLTVQTGNGCELRLRRGGRPWHADDGIIDDADRTSGSHVANLPAGALYTTVVEGATEGDLWLAEAGPAKEVLLHFEGGRVVDIDAREGEAEIAAIFDEASGESRRISHVGIGVNPRLHRSIGWVLVDEHIHGAFLVAFGENRYLGGENSSSLNVDFCSLDATVQVEGKILVERGRLRR